MDTELHSREFTDLKLTPFVCPECSGGNLQVVKDSLKVDHTRDSKIDSKHEAWEPEWSKLLYSCLMTCSNSVCNLVVTSSGTGRIERFQNYDQRTDDYEEFYEHQFKPLFFSPNLRIFKTPENINEKVEFEIERSFGLFFFCPASSANRLRSAIEHLLTDLGVNKTRLVNRKRRRLSLHERIMKMPSKFLNVKDQLMAVKWLGNAGSHDSNKISHGDVMDLYRILIVILEEIYCDRQREARGLAKKINKCKGPRRNA